MKIKTSEATEQQLNWLVAKCEGEPTYIDYHGRPRRAPGQFSDEELYTPTTDWAQGGPIIERLIMQKGLVLRCWVERGRCEASLDSPHRFSHGPTPLIAAMRCYVTSNLGDEVEIPDELIGE